MKMHIEIEEEDREEILGCRIPKLTLQPILENSIIHGTELKIGDGNLRIRFIKTDQRIIIRISDDGVGMDEETLSELNRRLGREGNTVSYQNLSNKGGIALMNVNNRIHLIFGEEYGLHLYSVLGSGTDAEITLPIVTSNDQISNRGILK